MGKEIHQEFLYGFRTYGKKSEDILDLAEVDSITLLYHLDFWEMRLQCRCSSLLLQMQMVLSRHQKMAAEALRGL